MPSGVYEIIRCKDGRDMHFHTIPAEDAYDALDGWSRESARTGRLVETDNGPRFLDGEAVWRAERRK